MTSRAGRLTLLESFDVVLASVQDSLPATDLENAREMVDANEFGVALEDLATQLVEYEAQIDAATHRSMAELAIQLKLDPDRVLRGLEPRS